MYQSRFMDVKEVEEYLGISYQTFHKELLPTNFSYSGDPGMPKNLYLIDDVYKYDDLYKYHETKSMYSISDVSKIVGRSSKWVESEITPTIKVKRGNHYYTFYSRKLIEQFLQIKSGKEITDHSTELTEKDQIIEDLQLKIMELEEVLNNSERVANVSIKKVFQRIIDGGLADIIIEVENEKIKTDK